MAQHGTPHSQSSLRATGSRECAPDDRLREAIHLARRHCERSEAIYLATVRKNGLLRCARNDVEGARNDVEGARNDVEDARNDVEEARNDVEHGHDLAARVRATRWLAMTWRSAA